MIEVRCEHFDEIENVTADIAVAADADACRAGLKQMAGVDGPEVFIALGIKSHVGQYADTQPQFHVSFDYVGIDCG